MRRKTAIAISSLIGLAVGVTVFGAPPPDPEVVDNSLCKDTNVNCGPIPPCIFPGQKCHHCNPTLKEKECDGIDADDCAFTPGITGANGCGNLSNSYCVDIAEPGEEELLVCQNFGRPAGNPCARDYCEQV